MKPRAVRPAARRASEAPRLILCAGMKSSGSTWLFNVVNRILKQARLRGVVSFYADTLAEFPAAAADARVVVVKTHKPEPALQVLAAFNHATVLLSVREPRDAIASLMARFDHAYAGAAREVIATADCLLAFYRAKPCPVFRYEERFYDRVASVRAIARRLGIALTPAAAQQIFAALGRDEVRRALADLTARGAFGAEPDGDRFDPATHWHPGHIGDLTIGKFAAWLTTKQQAKVLAAAAPYCATFGYPEEVAAAKKTPLRAATRLATRRRG